MIYQLIILCVTATAGIWGFKRGFTLQIPSVIGIAFAIITARLLSPAVQEMLFGAFPAVHGKVEQTFVYNTVSTATVFILVYVIFTLITRFLTNILSNGDKSILDNIGGALFGVFKALLFLSIIFNLFVAVNRDRESALLNFVRSDDGNIVEGVMLLSPSLLGGEDVEELSHRFQLEEAKKIS